jgi:RNA recognition motif. (a.k.a. RRM, RBD, or RNP domain)
MSKMHDTQDSDRRIVPCLHKICNACIQLIKDSARLLEQSKECCPFCRTEITGFVGLYGQQISIVPLLPAVPRKLISLSAVHRDVSKKPESVVEILSDGQWRCPVADCANVNWPMRTKCNRCGIDRPANLPPLPSRLDRDLARDQLQCNEIGSRFIDYRQLLYRILVTSMDGSEDWREHQVLKKVFGQYGNVLDVFLPKSKNMAYIAYEDEEVLERALGLKNMEIQGCRVCLTRADPPLDDRQREERRAASTGAASGKKPYTESEDNCQTSHYIVKSTQGKPEDSWLVEIVSSLYHSASNPNSFFGQETELGSLANPELGGVPRPHGVDVKVDVINFHVPNTTILVGCKLKCETLISAVSKAAHASSKEREESWFGFNKQRFMVGQHC